MRWAYIIMKYIMSTGTCVSMARTCIPTVVQISDSMLEINGSYSDVGIGGRYGAPAKT